MTNTPAWRAGYLAALAPCDSLIRAIEPPENFADEQKIDFVSGFIAGAKKIREEILIAELETWTQNI